MPASREQRQRRQAQIREILRAQPVERQSELVSLLRERGFVATQSSVSRDLKQLGISKLGEAYIEARETGAPELRPAAGLVRSVDTAGPNLTVIRTAVGGAQRVAVFLDRSDWTEIVGTVSGDDTIFVATKTGAEQRRLVAKLNSQIGNELS